MNGFWDSVWENNTYEQYVKYIDLKQQFSFIDIFKKYNVRKVCDAGCGFGKYSAICAYNKFDMYGFDISSSSVDITVEMLNKLQLPFKQYKSCRITDIMYDDEFFEGVTAHAVMDHMIYSDAVKAVNEVLRILKSGGLAYFTFDGFDEVDENSSHTVLEDGSYLYDDEKRKGMIFRYYSDSDIEKLFLGKEIIYRNSKANGEREIIVRKS